MILVDNNILSTFARVGELELLLTNNRRVRNFCREQGLTVFDLPRLLRASWENGVLSRNRVRRLADQTEAAENLVIRNKSAIFEPLSKPKRKRHR